MEFLAAKLTGQHLLLIWASLISAGVSDLEANETSLSSCKSVAPSPNCDNSDTAEVKDGKQRT